MQSASFVYIDAERLSRAEKSIPRAIPIKWRRSDWLFLSIRLCGWHHRQPKIHRQQFGLHAALRILLPILFPTRQRRHGDFRVFRIRPMHRLGIVAQRLLCEPLRKATSK